MNRIALRVVVTFIGVLSGTSIACYFGIARGVHLKYNAVDFGAPPPRFSRGYSDATQAWRPGTEYFSWSPDGELTYGREDPKVRKVSHLLEKAFNREMRLELTAASQIYRQLVVADPGKKESYLQRLDLLKSVNRNTEGLKGYLKATRLTYPSSTRSIPSSLGSDLRPYAAFEKAKASSDRAGLLAITRQYPRSSVAELSCFSALKLSLVGKVDLLQARQIIDEFRKLWPHSRHQFALANWETRIDYLKGRYDVASAKYRALLPRASTISERKGLLDSQILCAKATGKKSSIALAYLDCYRLAANLDNRHYATNRLEESLEKFDAKSANEFANEIKKSPARLCTYIEYRLDSQAPGQDVIELEKPAIAISKRSPYRARVLARLSEAALRLKQYPLATRLAGSSLHSKGSPNDHGLATYVLASLDSRNGQRKKAVRKFEKVVHSYRTSYLALAARENLALLYERERQLGKALDQYFALGYNTDVAYLIDVRMTPSDLRDYVNGHPRHEMIKKLRFSLGMRWFRSHKWTQAIRLFESLSAKERLRFMGKSDEGFWMEEGSKLYDPLVTCRQLQVLDSKVKIAGREQKANRLLEMADYYYSHRNLLLYNGALWHGMRAMAFASSWNTDVAGKSDDLALAMHHREHEAMYQSLILARQVVAGFPHTETAKRAAYRAACAAERLCHFNEYWRWESVRKGLGPEAVRMMKFAAKSKDATLAKKAAKYAKVFAQDQDMMAPRFVPDKNSKYRGWGGR